MPSSGFSDTGADLIGGASHQAACLGHHWMGEEHVLLALTVLGDDDRARTALAAAGVTHDAAVASCRARIVTDGPALPQEYSGIVSTPGLHDAEAAATRVAMRRGHDDPDSVDVLVGLLSVSGGPADVLLADLGTSKAAVCRALDEAGVPGAELLAAPIRNPLPAAAERQAMQRGDDWIGSQAVLLALLSGSPDDLAERALAVAGVTYGLYSDSFDESRKKWYPPAPAPTSGRTEARPNPATRRLFGRAEGFAARSGSGEVRSEHGLLAWLWEPCGNSVVELEMLSTSADTLLAALGELNVPPRSARLPQPDRTPRGEMVFLPPDRLSDVIEELRHLPMGSWGFNTYDGRSWVHGYAHIDLQAIVNRVLDGKPSSTA